MVRWAKVTIVAISLTFATFVWGSQISYNNEEEVFGSLANQESNEAFIERHQNVDLLWDDTVEDDDDSDSVIPPKTTSSNIDKRYHNNNNNLECYLILLFIVVHF